MKVGTYTKLTAQLCGLAVIWAGTACGSRSSLLQEEDAGVVTADASAQQSSSGGRAGRAGGGGNVARAGRGGSAGTAGRAQGTGRAGRSGRAGEEGDEPARGGAGGRRNDRDAAADSGNQPDQPDEPNEPTENESAGAGGEESGGAGGEQAGAGGEEAGSGGSAGASGNDAAGSGGAGTDAAGQGGAGAPAEAPRLTALTPDDVTAICARIDASVMNLAWGEGIRGYCARRGLAQPDTCAETRDACINDPDLVPICSQTIPECPNIFVDEFVSCRIDTLISFIEYNRTISCEAAPPVPEAAVPSCVGAYERCPPLAGLALQ